MNEPTSPKPVELSPQEIADRMQRARLAFEMLKVCDGQNIAQTLDVMAAVVARILQMSFTDSPPDCSALGFAFVGKVFEYFAKNPLAELDLTLKPRPDEVH